MIRDEIKISSNEGEFFDKNEIALQLEMLLLRIV